MHVGLGVRTNDDFVSRICLGSSALLACLHHRITSHHGTAGIPASRDENPGIHLLPLEMESPAAAILSSSSAARLSRGGILTAYPSFTFAPLPSSPAPPKYLGVARPRPNPPPTRKERKAYMGYSDLSWDSTRFPALLPVGGEGGVRRASILRRSSSSSSRATWLQASAVSLTGMVIRSYLLRTKASENPPMSNVFMPGQLFYPAQVYDATIPRLGRNNAAVHTNQGGVGKGTD
ncbi:hypothetical protein LZ31DRAFT_556574 [Colletotrichum somersetense]|nr:hypothetical protein LZ31DRAFT_556574 [Colletotrichum somersetense]